MKGELGRASVEVVRLEAYVGLLNKSNDRLEQKCAKREATITAYSRNSLCTANSNLNYVFQTICRRRLFMTDVE